MYSRTMKKSSDKKKSERRLWSRLRLLWKKSSTLSENHKNQSHQQSCIILDEYQLRMTSEIQSYKKKNSEL